MTLFEKIYFTLILINFVLLLIGCGTLKDNSLWKPFVIQIALTFLYEIIRFILLIWGINIDLFPSIKIIGN